jgi:hypothetical protein
LYTVWLVRCESPDDLRLLRPLLPARIDPDYTITELVRAFPGGAESRRVDRHRLGDYFADVRLLPGPPDEPSAFRMVFQRLPDAGRYWKDLMARVLGAVREAAGTATTTLDYRGEENPLEASGGGQGLSSGS